MGSGNGRGVGGGSAPDRGDPPGVQREMRPGETADCSVCGVAYTVADDGTPYHLECSHEDDHDECDPDDRHIR